MSCGVEPAGGARPASGATAWHGQLELEFEERGGRTVISRRRHRGPLLVQRAFLQRDGSCHVYVLHPPGGVVGGDLLSLAAVVGAEARALLTTPAATKIYRSSRVSQQAQQFRVRSGGLLEWLPQETIVYDGAHASATTTIELEGSAQFAGWDVTCLGRTDRGFTRGEIVQRFSLKREGRPLWAERAVFSGGGAALGAPWGLASRPVTGTFVLTGATDDHAAAVQAILPPPGRDRFSVTLLGEVLLVRYLGYSAEPAKQFFEAAWALSSSRESGRVALPARVWAT